MVRNSLNEMRSKNPEWLKMLLQSKFFGSCFDHKDLRKHEVNVFCIDCKCCICQHCIASSLHFRHKLLQIRRYVYHDVIRLHDIQKLFDCSRVQPYTINSAKVVFLNPRPQLKSSAKSNGGGAVCRICERLLTEPNNQYCSIACKVSNESEPDAKDLSRPYMNEDSLPLSDLFSSAAVKQNQKQESISIEDDLPQLDSSESGDSSKLHDSIDCNWLSTSTLKPKRQLSKRKGVPRRAPIC